MALFKPYKILKSQLDSLPKKDGQLIFVTDTSEIYLDESGEKRILLKQLYTASDINFSDGENFQTKYEQGELKGADGKDGESGVYIGDVAPEDPDINVWIDPNGGSQGVSKEEVQGMIDTAVGGALTSDY